LVHFALLTQQEREGKSMKNRKQILSTLSALALGVTIASPVLAASSGSLILSGTVAATNDLVVTPNGNNNTSLNIREGENDRNVATVSETSNDFAGYRIQMYSANGGKLQLAGSSSKQTAYQISYAGGSYVTPPLVASPVTVKSVTSLDALTTATSNVLVNVTAYSGAPAGTYSDTLTFSIVGN
jgi:hypothetical protein